MLDKKVPADFIGIKYPYFDSIIRFHKHTDNNSIWIVLADICNILGLTNVSYTSSKLNQENVYKHKIHTDGGVQAVTWVEINEAIELAKSHCNRNLVDYLREMNIKLKNINKPVIIEQEVFLKLLSVIDDITHSNYCL